MAFKMRQSKFRHVFAQPYKKDQCYDNIRISKSSLDCKFCSVNPKFVAIITEAAGGGSFLVLPLSKTGRVERDHPMVTGHTGAVLDIKWCPHNDNVIASCGEDTTVKVWQIPDEVITTNITEPVVDLCAHQRRVHYIEWHPSALNLLLSSGADHKIFLWNVGVGEVLVEMDLPDLCLSMSFNYDGTQFVTTCKDKKMRIFETRTGKMLKEKQAHDGSKPAQAVFLKDNKIFTTGFSKMSERQYALWDTKDLSEPMNMEVIDTSNGVIFPFYDGDTNMVWLCGKGDSIIRFYEVTEEAPFVHYLNLYQTKESQRGIGMMPKRGLNVCSCEITRFYKLLNNGLCEVLPMVVPRKSDLFQDDLYPDTPSDEPACTADQFMEGCDSTPVLCCLKDKYAGAKKEQHSAVRKSNVLDTPNKLAARKSNVLDTPSKVTSRQTHHEQPASATSNGAAEAPTQAVSAPTPAPAGPALPADFDPEKLLKDVSDLKAVIKQQDKKIAALEARVKEFEGTGEEEVKEED
ncbi:coronin-6-like isoform X2 [Mercenaria mercenaria]|uniref:coronin-6-like isoform X2 n=1 Tax=Mercenaria mercenaria TaxID=6596 RepID=UPI001E1DEE5E|nr:coronin-6-like isoform X2 [Mercenaria mercenaria]